MTNGTTSLPARTATLVVVAALAGGCGRVGFETPGNGEPDAAGRGDTGSADAAAGSTHVQSGETVLPEGESTIFAPLEPVDPRRSFLLFTVRGDSANPSELRVIGRLTDATTLLFERRGTAGSVDIAWFVASSPLFSVQRRSSSLPGRAIDETIAAVNPSSAFPVISTLTGGDKFDENDWVRAELTGPETLHLDVTNNGTTGQLVEWQVVEIEGARVEHGNVTIQPADLSTTAALASPTDPTRTWLLYSYTAEEGTANNIAQKLVLGTFVDAMTLAFSRAGEGTSSRVTWHAIEMPAGTAVHRGQLHLAVGERAGTVSFPAVSDATTFATDGNMLNGGMADFTLDDNPGSAWATLRLRSDTIIELDRGHALSEADIGWSVVSLP